MTAGINTNGDVRSVPRPNCNGNKANLYRISDFIAMEISDPDFPVRHASISLDVQGNETEIIISSYGDHVLVMATQIGTMGTILHARKEEGLAVDPTFDVSVVFGKRDEPMLLACARQIIQHISDSGSSKALVLSLGLRDHSMETMKAIVSAIIEKLPEAT